jgi:hypothetical protein
MLIVYPLPSCRCSVNSRGDVELRGGGKTRNRVDGASINFQLDFLKWFSLFWHLDHLGSGPPIHTTMPSSNTISSQAQISAFYDRKTLRVTSVPAPGTLPAIPDTAGTYNLSRCSTSSILHRLVSPDVVALLAFRYPLRYDQANQPIVFH